MMKKVLLALCAFLYVLNMHAQQWNGYTLYSLQNSSDVYLMDTNQVTYHSWTTLPAQTGYSTYMEPGGTIVRAAKGGTSPSGAPMGPICGKVQKHNYAGTLVWDYTYAGTDYISHHDICPMPNGNVLVIAYERKTATEVTAAGGTSAIQMWPDKIVEIQPTGATTGNIVWEWHTWDHLVQNKYPTKANYVSDSIYNHPELININYKQTADWQHMNGIDYNPILDQIAFSSRNFNEWFVIDHSTTTAEAATHSGGNSGKGGDILYRWGNPAAYGATGTAILNVTHDVHWIQEGVPNAGRMAGLNNKGISNTQSSAEQIITPINGYNYSLTLGQAFLPASYTDRHACNGYTSNMGSTQQLPNGNQIICLATSPKFYEINAAGNVLFTKTFTGNSFCPQARKYDLCYINNIAPPIPTITVNGSVLTSSSATTYQWYMNGVLIAGATSQSFTPTLSGVFIVRTTDANGCVFEYSKGLKFEKPNAIAMIDLSNQVNFYPNPTDGVVKIITNNTFGNQYEVSIVNTLGVVIKKLNSPTQIDMTSLSSGMYSIIISSSKGKAIKKIILNK